MNDNQSDNDTANKVAIVGMACRYPEANGLDNFWQLICQRREVLHQFSDEALLASGIPKDLINSATYVKVGSSLDNIDQFDASFFAYSPSEASLIDPQQRLFLETAYQALEHAACDPFRYDGRIAVFAGTDVSEYFLNNLMSRRWELERRFGFDLLVASNDKDSLTTRVSYKLNLRGPSVQVSTNCSTSLVATWLGWQSLVDYQSDMALVGGVYCPPGKRGHMFVQGAHYSPDGKCRPFDAKGQGIRVGAGVGVVVLKRLEDALADGDQIYSVICGAAVNHDGANKVGYTAPSVFGQSEVIAEALAIADFTADTIGYVEAHGTATPLGDPVEVAALTKAYRNTTEKKQYCRIGSVKGNIGHSMNAAGVGGLIKATMALHHGKLPPSINFETPNPQIDFENSPFYVGTELADWKQPAKTPRRAAVSAFGLGGTNAHVVLEQAPPLVKTSPSPRKHQLLVLSAKTRSALDRASENLVRHLLANTDLDLADVSHTLLLGRAELLHRRVIVVESVEQLMTVVAQRDDQRVFTGEASDRAVAWLFPGANGAMASTASLYANESVFHESVDKCAIALSKHLGGDIRDALYPKSKSKKVSGLLVEAAPFAIGYALSQLLLSWGIKPRAVIGWGVGEYAAACAAGVFNLDDAAASVATLLQRKSKADRDGAPVFTRAQLKTPGLSILDGSGHWVKERQATDPSYWNQRLFEPANGEPAWSALPGDQSWVVLALGPGVKQPANPIVLQCLPGSDDERDDADLFLSSVARLWALGGVVDWKKSFGEQLRRRVALPSYPFERVRCWIDPMGVESGQGFATAPASAPLVLTSEAAASFNEIEREMALMWKDVLGVEPADTNDDFLKLGGDSLMVSRLVARVREKYEIEASMESFLQATTLATMSEVVAGELIKDLGEDLDEEELAELLRAAEEEGE